MQQQQQQQPLARQHGDHNATLCAPPALASLSTPSAACLLQKHRAGACATTCRQPASSAPQHGLILQAICADLSGVAIAMTPLPAALHAVSGTRGIDDELWLLDVVAENDTSVEPDVVAYSFNP